MTYIVKNEKGAENDFHFIKVPDHQVADFELEYQNKVLAKGPDLQAALTAFGEKVDKMEPISLNTPDQEIRSEGYRRRQ